ncbi:MAG: hypothetical protein ABIK15_06295 [Pseudomonadota bacterium]
MKPTSAQHLVLTPFLHRLAAVFSEMDQAYQRASDHYHFHCSGCDENCCLTHFFHHTHLEYFYVLEGIGKTDPCLSTSLYKRARDVYRKSVEAMKQGKGVRLMCPLNQDGLCVIYNHRPMICRMHGIPHELNAPGRKTGYGPGCKAFDIQCGNKPYIPFDRTPFYASMANLENEMKQHLGITERFKKTIAQMLVE